MTKINNKNRRRRTHHPAVTLTVIILLIGVLIFVSKMLADNASDIVEDNKKGASNTTENTKAERTPAENQTPTDDGDHKTPIQNDGDDPNTKDSLTGVITMAEASNGMVHIRVNIDQYLSSGTCKLDMHSDSGVTFNDNAVIIPTASTSTCEGFDIPVSNLTSGHWSININLETSDKTGVITGDINI